MNEKIGPALRHLDVPALRVGGGRQALREHGCHWRVAGGVALEDATTAITGISRPVAMFVAMIVKCTHGVPGNQGLNTHSTA